ncbi:MAG: PQQ-dependent sugar dehydrogenase [Planctomycetota bacterium]
MITPLSTVALAMALQVPEAPGDREDPAGAARAFSLANGLELALYAAEPALSNPVALAVDDRGRVLVVETHRYLRSVFDVVTYQTDWLPADLGLRTVGDRRAFLMERLAADPGVLTADAEIVRRIEDRDGDGRGETSIVLAKGWDAPECGPIAGVLPIGEDVWVTCIPELAVLRGGGPPERVHTGFGVHVGVSGHDLHGLALGPDGRLYFSVGDRGAHVVTPDRGTIDLPDTGAVFRCELDGSALEVFAIGLRNPQELAFDAHGNLFTADNDTAGDDRSRLIHVVPGADYGWRCSYQHMLGFGPWVQEEAWRGGVGGALPHAGYVAQGPSGLAFDVGHGLGERWRGCFFVCDFPGGITAFRVERDGATFRAAGRERVVWNLWPTDVDFGPDGALYASDWVAGWGQPLKGRVWRITGTPTGTPTSAPAAPLELAALASDDVAALLEHVDRRVRTRAHLELAGRADGLDRLRTRLREAPLPLTRLHAAFGLAVAARRSAAGAASTQSEAHIEALREALLDPAGEVRAAAARALGELGSDADVPHLLAGVTDVDALAAAECALALGRLGRRDPLGWMGRTLDPIRSAAPQLVEDVQRALVALLTSRGASDPYLAHAATLGLLAWCDDTQLAGLATHAAEPVQRAALTALRRARSPRIAAFLTGALRADAARAIHDEAIVEARDALAACDEDPDPVVARRALTARLQRRGADDAAALARAASRGPEAIGRHALSLLATWAEPGPLDPVVGLWRPLPPAPVAAARAALAPHSAALLQGPLASEALATMLALRDEASAPSALEVARDASRPGALRARACDVWATLTGALLPPDLGAAWLASDESALRQAALRHADPNDPAVRARLAPLVRDRGRDPAVAAAALERLVAGPRTASEPIVLEGLAAYVARGTHPLAVEFVAAAEALGGGALGRALAEVAALEADLGRYRRALVGGDPAAGRAVFEQKAALECLRCHATARPEDAEGKVGPSLADIGARLDGRTLLEAILAPDARIAEGYGTVIVALQDGTLHTGVPVAEDPEWLTLRTADGEWIDLDQTDIRARKAGQSAMPGGLAERMELTELRDLLAFLGSLRARPAPQPGH